MSPNIVEMAKHGKTWQTDFLKTLFFAQKEFSGSIIMRKKCAKSAIRNGGIIKQKKKLGKF